MKAPTLPMRNGEKRLSSVLPLHTPVSSSAALRLCLGPRERPRRAPGHDHGSSGRRFQLFLWLANRPSNLPVSISCGYARAAAVTHTRRVYGARAAASHLLDVVHAARKDVPAALAR